MPVPIHFVEEDAPAIDVAEDAAPVIHFVEEKLPMSDEDAWSMIRKYSNPQPGLESPTPATEPSEPGFAKLPRFSSTTTGPAPAQFGENSILGDPAEVFTQAKGIADAISYLTPLPAAARLGIKGLQRAASMIPTGSQEAWERFLDRSKYVGGAFGGGYQGQDTSTYTEIPESENRERNAAFLRAIAEQAKGLAEFTVSDLGLATIAAGGPIAGAAAKVLPWAGRAIKTLISAGFTADIASKVPAQYEKYLIAQDHGTPDEKVVATVELVAALGMLGMTTLHAATGTAKLASPVVEAVTDSIGYANRLRRGVNAQDATKVPELGDQFIPGIAGTRGSAFDPGSLKIPLSPEEQAVKLGLTRTAEAAAKARGRTVDVQPGHRLSVEFPPVTVQPPGMRAVVLSEVPAGQPGVAAQSGTVIPSVEIKPAGDIARESRAQEVIPMRDRFEPIPPAYLYKYAVILEERLAKIANPTPQQVQRLNLLREAINNPGRNLIVLADKLGFRVDEFATRIPRIAREALGDPVLSGAEPVKRETKGGETSNVQKEKEGVQVAPTAEPPVITPPEVPETKGGEIPNATQTETPVGGVSPTSTGTAPIVGEGTPSSGGQPGGARTETTQTETPALTAEAAPPAPATRPTLPKLPPGAGLTAEQKAATFAKHQEDVAQWKKDMAAWEASMPPNQGSVFQDESNVHMVTRDPQGGWRITRISNADQMPAGHMLFKTRLEALSDYSVRDAKQIEKVPFEVKPLPQEAPVTPAVPPTPPPPTPPPIIPPLGDYERPAGSPIGIKNAEIDKLRAEMGMEPIAKAAGLPDKVLWQRVMDRIEQDPHWIDTVISDIKKTGRGHTNDEALGLNHRLVETRTEFYRESRKAAKARDTGDVFAEAQAKVNVNFWSDKLVELELIVTSSGSTLGSAFRARQFMMNEDFSLAALELKKRKAKDWEGLSDAERTEIEKIHADYVAKTAELKAHLDEQSGKRVDAEIKLAAAEAARGPSYDPRLLKIVEDFAGFMDKQASSAMDRIKARHSGKGEVRIDWTLGTKDVVADVADLAIYGAAKITRKINDFAKWSDAMIEDFGRGVEPHLKAAWEASKVLYQKSLDERLKTKDPATKAKAKAALTGQDVAEKIEAAKDKIAAKVEKGQPDEIFYPVQALVRAIVERDPKIARGPLINEVHGVLKEFIPDIEKMDTMDAITGVGRHEIPKQDIVSRAVRELKTQTRLASHFIRVLMKEALPRTGYQHGKLSDVSRNLTTRINEAKRKFPLEPSDPESQLGSILQSRKTYYTHRMADLQAEIKARQRKVKTATPSPTDPELDALIEKYTTVKREHDEIFGRPELTEAQKLERLEKSATRQIVELQRQVDTGDVFPKPKQPSSLSSDKLVALRARIEALTTEREYVRERLNPTPVVDPFVLAIIHARARIARKLADYTQRVADGDYAPRTKKPPVDITQDKQAMSLMADLQKVKRDFDKGLALDEAKKRSGVQKLLAGTGEVLNIPRALWSSFDLSAVGRQGAVMLMGHPIRSAKSVVPMIKALFSEKAALIEEQKIINRPNYQNGNYAKSELYLASLDEFRLNRQEEIMMSHFSNLIPGVRASNRAFMTYLNKLRADSFDVMLQSRERWFSKPVEQFEKDAISNYINISTGRGYLGNHAAAAQTLATIFWAPRLMASRIQYLSGQPALRYILKKGGWRTSAMIAKEYAQTLMGMGAVIGLAKLAGADIETDRNSSDFLKLKFGNARVDIMGGLFQNVVFVNRLLISGKIKTASGKEKLVKAGPLIWDFARNKFTPIIGTALDVRDLALGLKPPAGHPQSLGDLVLNLPVPLSFRDVYTMLREEGVPATSALTLVSIFGWGVQYYDSLAGEKPSAKPTYPDSMFRPRTPTRSALQP